MDVAVTPILIAVAVIVVIVVVIVTVMNGRRGGT
jgi:hypothetical protein